MIERVVMLKLKDELANEAGRSEVAAFSVVALREVPGVVDVVARVPADEASAASWDLMLRVGFASVVDVERYVDHPVHVRFVEDYLKPRITFRKAWNFNEV
jgi:hypothetical protein